MLKPAPTRPSLLLFTEQARLDRTALPTNSSNSRHRRRGWPLASVPGRLQEDVGLQHAQSRLRQSQHLERTGFSQIHPIGGKLSHRAAGRGVQERRRHLRIVAVIAASISPCLWRSGTRWRRQLPTEMRRLRSTVRRVPVAGPRAAHRRRWREEVTRDPMKRSRVASHADCPHGSRTTLHSFMSQGNPADSVLLRSVRRPAEGIAPCLKLGHVILASPLDDSIDSSAPFAADTGMDRQPVDCSRVHRAAVQRG